MAYDPILEAEIQQDEPITTDLLQKIKGNFEYLYSLIGSAGGGGGSSSGVPNGSFEIDEDADNIPDTWTRYLYAGGSAAYETAAPGHGAKAYKFTRALGTNNGGGYLTSDYVACAPETLACLMWLHKSSTAGLHNIVQLLWYDKSQVYLSTSTLYDSTANPTSWALAMRSAAAPAGAMYFKIRLIGGYTDTDVAGDSWFDGVTFAPGYFANQVGTIDGIVSDAVWNNTPGHVTFNLGKLSAQSHIRITASLQTYGTVSGEARLRIGSETIVVDASGAWTRHEIGWDLYGLTGGEITMYADVRYTGGSGNNGARLNADDSIVHIVHV